MFNDQVTFSNNGVLNCLILLIQLSFLCVRKLSVDQENPPLRRCLRECFSFLKLCFQIENGQFDVGVIFLKYLLNLPNYGNCVFRFILDS